jgi:hypothetical protein
LRQFHARLARGALEVLDVHREGRTRAEPEHPLIAAKIRREAARARIVQRPAQVVDDLIQMAVSVIWPEHATGIHCGQAILWGNCEHVE